MNNYLKKMIPTFIFIFELYYFGLIPDHFANHMAIAAAVIIGAIQYKFLNKYEKK